MPNVAIVLTDNFPILSLTLVTEPLRVASQELARNEWHWRIVSASGSKTRSSSGIDV